MRDVNRVECSRGDVVRHGTRQNEIAIGETLHERTRAEPVGAVIGEVRFTTNKQSRDSRHQVVIHPEAAHSVMRSGIDPHRHGVRVLSRDPLIDVEQISVLIANCFQTKALNGIHEVQLHTLPMRPDTASFVAYFLSVSRCDVAGYEVTKTRVPVLQIIVAFAFRDILRSAHFTLLLWHPNSSIVSQRFGHQRQLRLMLAALTGYRSDESA